MIPGEFSRPVRLDTIGSAPHMLQIEADAGERAALARRFGLISLDRLQASVTLRTAGDDVLAEGRVLADAVQACAATGAPVPAAIDAPFALRFRPEGAPEHDEEVELGADEIDTLPLEGGSVDVGEAAAQTLALALDPFPRADGAAETLRAAGVKDEGEDEGEDAGEAGPFGALAALKDKLKG